MSTTQESIHIHALVAIFAAAFDLGFDPYALAVQAKLEVAMLDEGESILLAPAAEQVINESLLVAKIRRFQI